MIGLKMIDVEHENELMMSLHSISCVAGSEAEEILIKQ